LNQNSSAIALQLVGTDRAAMRQVLQHLQAFGHDIVTFSAFNVRHKPHAARVVLVFRVVKALR
jgi:hypothetical protein